MTELDLRQLRARHGWSQEELGRRMGLTPSAVSRRESGQTRINLEELGRLSESMGVGVSEIMASAPAGTLAERLRQYRARIGVSQTELADRLQIGQSQMSRLEQGAAPAPELADRIEQLIGPAAPQEPSRFVVDAGGGRRIVLELGPGEGDRVRVLEGLEHLAGPAGERVALVEFAAFYDDPSPRHMSIRIEEGRRDG